jgi:hypothetical protein
MLACQSSIQEEVDDWIRGDGGTLIATRQAADLGAGGLL